MAVCKDDGQPVAGHGLSASQVRPNGRLLHDFQPLPLLPRFGAAFALRKCQHPVSYHTGETSNHAFGGANALKPTQSNEWCAMPNRDLKKMSLLLRYYWRRAKRRIVSGVTSLFRSGN